MSEIRTLAVGAQDRRLLADLLSEGAVDRGQGNARAVQDYSDAVVRKPWGYEYLAFDNGQVAIWVLHIARKRRTSMHCHPNKSTGLIVLSGTVQCRGLDGACQLESMDALVIERGCFHSSEAVSDYDIYPPSENGVWLLEIESPADKVDLVRASDEYGRAGQPYEAEDSIVGYRHDRIRLALPGNEEAFECVHMGYAFRIAFGVDSVLAAADDDIVTPIQCDEGVSARVPGLVVGRPYRASGLRDLIGKRDVSGCAFLTVRKENATMKLSDYVADFIADLGVRDVFAVSGGGAMHLVDSVGKNERLNYVAMHHEQAAAMAAEAYSRITGFGAGLFTTGPGGTNALTGVICAWVDSIPTIFVSGQVTQDTLLEGHGLRQYGIQESDIVTLVRSVTKYSVCVTDPRDIKYEMEKAAYIARSGRPGPVWVDIPLDVQSKQINVESLREFVVPECEAVVGDSVEDQIAECIALLRESERPVLICGYGIHLSGAERVFLELVERLGIPVVSSWTASDLIASDHPCYVGRSGIFGDRASNFAVQNADLLLIIGSRMSIPQVGYNYQLFAREAKIIMVDVDRAEMAKPSLHVDLGIELDAGRFIDALLTHLDGSVCHVESWSRRCQEWKSKYPVVLPEYRDRFESVNSFYFIDVLSSRLPSDAVVITDMGTSFTCTMQTFRVKQGQRLTTASGHAPMGYGLPGVIGACIANGRRKTIGISGDGGLQMNIQELQTMVHLELPIILFVLNNGGYLTIKHMQQNHFGRYVGSEASSGVTCPDMLKISRAYGIPCCRIADQATLDAEIDDVLSHQGPYICEIMMPEDQPLIPRLSSLKKPDGTIVSKPLEDLYPFLDRKEFRDNMIVNPVDDFD